MKQRIAEDPSEAAKFYHRIASLTKDEFKSLKKEHNNLLKTSANQTELSSKLEILEREKMQLEDQATKSAKGTRLVISL